MTEKQTTVLGFITLFAVLGAVWLLFGERSDSPNLSHGHALYPELAHKLGDVRSLDIKGPLNTTSIKQDGSLWRIAEKDGYPADTARIRALLKGLADADIAHVKTDNPALYDRLGLGDEALHVLVKGSDGKTLVALDIGDRTYENSAFLTYVRPRDDPRSYQVTALPEIIATPVQWLDQTLLHLARARISDITLTCEGDPAYTLSRSSQNGSFGIEGEDRPEEDPSTAFMNMVATAYTDLRFQDVRRSGTENAPTPAEGKGRAVVRTFDGLTLQFDFKDSLDETGDVWVTIKAEYTAPDEATLPQTLTDVPQDGVAEAHELSARFEGWAFRLDRALASSLLKQRSTLEEEIGPLD